MIATKFTCRAAKAFDRKAIFAKWLMKLSNKSLFSLRPLCPSFRFEFLSFEFRICFGPHFAMHCKMGTLSIFDIRISCFSTELLLYKKYSESTQNTPKVRWKVHKNTPKVRWKVHKNTPKVPKKYKEIPNFFTLFSYLFCLIVIAPPP